MNAVALLGLLATTTAKPSARDVHYRNVGEAAANITCADDPPLLSWHIHVLFWQSNPASVKAAEALRTRFIAQFPEASRPCVQGAGDWHDLTPGICDIGFDYVQHGGNGTNPFLAANWAFFVPVKDFGATVPWVMERRGQLDLFVHPNSGCMVRSHLSHLSHVLSSTAGRLCRPRAGGGPHGLGYLGWDEVGA